MSVGLPLKVVGSGSGLGVVEATDVADGRAIIREPRMLSRRGAGVLERVGAGEWLTGGVWGCLGWTDCDGGLEVEAGRGGETSG